MGTKFAEFRKSLQTFDPAATKRRGHADIDSIAKATFGAVGEFLAVNNLGVVDRNVTRANTSISIESLPSQLQSSEMSIDALLEQAGIPANMREQATADVELALYKHFINTEAFEVHNRPADPSANAVIPWSNLFSPNGVSRMQNSELSQESFGVNINTAQTDLKMAISVAIMKYHTGIMTRMLPVEGTTDPTIQYRVPHYEAFSLATGDSNGTELLELFRNPASVTGSLVPVIVRVANATAGEVVEDGVLAFNKEAHLLRMALDATKYNTSTVNHHDILADNVRLVSFKFKTGSTTDESGVETNQVITLVMPLEKSRLTRLTDTLDVSDRALLFKNNFYLSANTIMDDGNKCAWISGDLAIGANEFIKVAVAGNASANLRTCMAECNARFTVSGYVNDSDTPSGALTTAVAALNNCELIGYSLDVRYSEENMQKTSIALREHVRPFSYNLPIGRNYVIEPSLHQTTGEGYTAALSKLMELSEDDMILTLLQDHLANVGTQLVAAERNLENVAKLNRYYVAGAMVNPFVKTYNIDFSQMHSRSDGEKPADIKQRFVSFMTAVVAEMLFASLIREQLAAGMKVNFRALTSYPIIDCILAQKHWAASLEVGNRPASNDIGYRMELANDVSIEFVPTCFERLDNTILMIPFFTEDQNNVLNAGKIWDMGSVSGNIIMTEQGVRRRMYANSRKMFVPTNPFGAVITITGAYEVNKRAGIQYTGAYPSES